MKTEQARRGRKARSANPGERVSLGLKVTGEIKNKLDAAAKENGRTQSQEAEVRLENSFRNERIISEALELAYGRIDADMLLSLLGEILKTAQQVTNMFSDFESWMDNKNTCVAVSEVLHKLFSFINSSHTFYEDDEYGRRRDHYYINRQILKIMNNEEWLQKRRSRFGERTLLFENWLTDLKKKVEAEEAKPLDVEAMTRHITIMKDDDDGTIVGGGQ